MKKLVILALICFGSAEFAVAQFTTLVIPDSTDPITIEIPEGKVLEVRNFIAANLVRHASLRLTKDSVTIGVMKSASSESPSTTGSFHAFVGPATLSVVPYSVTMSFCLTYRLFETEEPDAEPVRPIIQVQTICRCRKGR
jgi:hypothetical protein